MNNSSFIAKKAKTFEEESVVAEKAPVDGIQVNDLNKKKTICPSARSIFKSNPIKSAWGKGRELAGKSILLFVKQRIFKVYSIVDFIIF